MKKIVTLIMTAGLVALATNAGATTLNLPLVTDSGTIDEAIYSRFAESGQGTGNFDSFLRVQATPTETGYNTDGVVEFDTKDDPHTHAIMISDIPIFEIDGTNYYEFALDAAEPGGNSLSIDIIEIYLLNSPTVTGYAANIATTTAYYTLDVPGSNNVVISGITGNGIADLFLYVPVSNFAGAPVADKWVYFYTNMDDTAGSFEEWGRRILDDPGGCTENCDPTVPEPASMVLFGTGLVGIIARKRKTA